MKGVFALASVFLLSIASAADSGAVPDAPAYHIGVDDLVQVSV